MNPSTLITGDHDLRGSARALPCAWADDRVALGAARRVVVAGRAESLSGLVWTLRAHEAMPEVVWVAPGPRFDDRLRAAPTAPVCPAWLCRIDLPDRPAPVFGVRVQIGGPAAASLVDRLSLDRDEAAWSVVIDMGVSETPWGVDVEAGASGLRVARLEPSLRGGLMGLIQGAEGFAAGAARVAARAVVARGDVAISVDGARWTMKGPCRVVAGPCLALGVL